jgi:hypothetical protein
VHTAMPTPTARPRHLPRSLNLLSSRAIAASEPPQHVQRRRLRASWCTNPGEQACSRRRGHSDKTGLGRRLLSPTQVTLTPDTHPRKHTATVGHMGALAALQLVAHTNKSSEYLLRRRMRSAHKQAFPAGGCHGTRAGPPGRRLPALSVRRPTTGGA